MSNKISNELLRFNIQRFDHYFNLATTKAALIIPAGILLLVYLFENQSTYIGLLDDTCLSSLTRVTFVGVILTASISILLSVYVVKAYLKGGPQSNSNFSLLFFGSIAKKDLEIFKERIEKVTEELFYEDMTQQVYLLAKGLNKKYEVTNWSLYFLIAAFIQLVVIFIISILVN